MKKLLGILALTATLAACHDNGYKIEGSINGMNEGDTLILTNDLTMMQALDTLIVKDGKFSASGTADSTQLCVVYAMNNPRQSAMFFLEPGTINLTIDEEPGKSKVSGTKVNDAWQKITDISNSYGEQMEQKSEKLYDENLSDEERQAIMSELDKLNNELMAKIIECGEENIDNELGYFVLVNIPDNNVMTPEKRMEMIDKLPSHMRERDLIQQIIKMVEASKATAKGQVIEDFSQATPDGGELSAMAEIKQHKITIIDFWASWCGPCRQEMPSMKSLYKDFKDKGLGIIGVSLDEDKDAWVKAIEELGIQWPQMSDLQGWNSSAAQQFQVNAIPHLIIVDENGTILERGLRGEEVRDFVSKRLQ